LKKTTKNLHLEVVRGMAAFLVVIGHLINKFPEIAKHKNHFTNLIGNWATESVIVFFVLSGIVIHSSVQAKHKSAKSFLIDRMVRINPILLIAVIISVLLEIYLFNYNPPVKMIIGNLIPVSTMQGYMVDVFWNTNPVIWSLSFEMFFYVVFAIFVIKKDKISQRNILIWASLGLAAIYFYFNPISENIVVNYLILMLAYSPIWIIGFYIWKFRNDIYTSFVLAIASLCCLPIVSRAHFSDNYYDPIRNVLFALCSIPLFLYLIQDKRENVGLTFLKKNISAIIISFTYLLSLLFIYNDQSYPILSRLLYIILPICIVFVTFFKKIIINIYEKFVVKLFTKIGSLSYSIYLIHNPILIILAALSNISIFIKIPLFVITTYFVCYFLEKIYQPFIKNFIVSKLGTFNKTNVN
jgi:peptidoglycan/LPS O-acetylase OafA/YrhL